MNSAPGIPVTIKDLCIDAVDPAVLAPFYGAALGLAVTPVDDGDFRLDDAVDAHRVWVNRVPEPRTVKSRVHLDVHVGGVDDLVALGATVQREQAHWTVLADPEGGEVCAFVREPDRLTDYRLYEVVVDAADHLGISRWWGQVFGVTPEHDREQAFSWLEGGGLPWVLVFASVPEPKTVKNRIHWDVWGDTPALVEAGAQLVRERNAGTRWDVLADPEGNEFCVFARS